MAGKRPWVGHLYRPPLAVFKDPWGGGGYSEGPLTSQFIYGAFYIKVKRLDGSELASTIPGVSVSV